MPHCPQVPLTDLTAHELIEFWADARSTTRPPRQLIEEDHE